MRKSRFTEGQMVKILRDADRAPVPEVAKRHGVSEATLYAWRKRFGSMDVQDTKRLQALEAKTTRLKQLVAERGRRLGVHERFDGVGRRGNQLAYDLLDLSPNVGILQGSSTAATMSIVIGMPSMKPH